MVVFQNQGLAQGINALSSTLGPILQEAAKQRRKSDILSRIFSKEPVDQQGQQSQQEEQPEDQQLQSPLNRGMNREALFEYAQVDPQGANFLLQQDIAREKMDLKQEERAFKRNEKYLQQQDKIRQDLPAEKVSLQQMEASLASGDFNSFRNGVADLTGQEWLKTASAQAANSASKQFLMSSLSGLTGRPNQFLEQQITKALISPQYKKEANRLIIEGLKGLHKLKKMEADTASELEEKYTSKGREIPRAFQRHVKQRIEDEAQKFEDKYEKRLIKELDIRPKKGYALVKTPDGDLKQVPRNKVQEAQKAGGKILNVG